MRAENYILAMLAGFLVGYVFNAITKSRFSFPVNLFVGVFGAILLNFFLRGTEMISGRFFPTLGVSLAGSIVLLGLFHLSRITERRR